MDDFIYVSTADDWEDTIIYISKKEAIDKSFSSRIEIFSKTPTSNGYTPTYNYYQNGRLIITSASNNAVPPQSP